MITRLKCLLLDDELPGLTYLKMLCEQMDAVEVVKAYNNPETFLKESSSIEYDFCIIDIEMPGMNGLQVAKALKGKPVIFTTAYKEYAAEAFDLHAIDYVRKPVKRERLAQAIEKLRNVLPAQKTQQPFIQLNTDKGKAVIYIHQLLYIKTSDVDSRDKQALLTNHSMITLKNISFEKLQEILPADVFARVNKKEMIALPAVQTFSADGIVTGIPLENNSFLRLSLSDAYRKDFMQKIGR